VLNESILSAKRINVAITENRRLERDITRTPLM